tara:strand:+ start:58 stop:447 length:390 start_codon:yes stop_codon:yes gene_type:complete
MLESYISAWKHTFNFAGKSKRKEYWLFSLVGFLAPIFLLILQAIIHLIYLKFADVVILSSILQIIFLVFSIFVLAHGCGLWVVSSSITVRRLRDIGKTWQWIFLLLFPIVGWLVIIYWMTLPSRSEKVG